jgi:hypothetical protein
MQQLLLHVLQVLSQHLHTIILLFNFTIDVFNQSPLLFYLHYKLKKQSTISFNSLLGSFAYSGKSSSSSSSSFLYSFSGWLFILLINI